MSGTEQRLERLEQRLRELEDREAIQQLLAAYGPLVDSGSAEAVAALWGPDGVYDYQADAPTLEGRDGIRAMVRSDAHQGYLQEGCGHLVGAPWVHLDGDTAVATGYSVLVRRRPEGAGYRVARLSANRWELARGEEGWRVTRRTNRLLDGRADGRELLAEGSGLHR